MPTTLISGSSSGIGLEFARQYAARGWKVIATCRRPQAATELQALARDHANVQIEPLDVTSSHDVARLADLLGDEPIDVLLNNAGVMGSRLDSQKLGVLDFMLAVPIMETNFCGPLRLSEAFRRHVGASECKKVVCITSGNGSLTLTTAEETSGLYFYRASKAALNVAMAAFSRDCQPDAIKVLLLSPGLVDSNFAAGSGADLSEVRMISARESVCKLIPLIDQTYGDSIRWLRYTGETVPW